MKNTNFLPVILLLLFFAGCTSDNIKTFIPGTYVTDINQEFAKGSDTLVITPLGRDGITFQVFKKASFRRILDGKLQDSVEVKEETRTGIYDNDKKIMTDMKTGTVISFKPDEKALFRGTTRYTKVK